MLQITGRGHLGSHFGHFTALVCWDSLPGRRPRVPEPPHSLPAPVCPHAGVERPSTPSPEIVTLLFLDHGSQVFLFSLLISVARTPSVCLHRNAFPVHILEYGKIMGWETQEGRGQREQRSGETWKLGRLTQVLALSPPVVTGDGRRQRWGLVPAKGVQCGAWFSSGWDQRSVGLKS